MNVWDIMSIQGKNQRRKWMCDIKSNKYSKKINNFQCLGVKSSWAFQKIGIRQLFYIVKKLGRIYCLIMTIYTLCNLTYANK